ncbi:MULTISPECIES: M14 family metallocarboxypeptidase [Gammaproteobacteria]|uniref:M14 family metallopeptidase n=1 Tax=Gammaproteobacteria TaxID=1236 RepID=UPI000DCF7706|nr:MULTISPECIES: M14 family metallocarboxypeptidase [Gammaproteobacteria]RTE86925.1 peptidase [Aliidiomarina sp. B3213]TCZ93285.1 peptidase [Lysobacter sp. N42]
MAQEYPIGKPFEPWGEAEKKQWLESQSRKRLYEEDVISAIEGFKSRFTVEQYGTLNYDKDYPLFAVRSKKWVDERSTVLVTGGVHGYETSGVHGALAFIDRDLEMLGEQVNVVVLPCISPWGYETINRWNPAAEDPNRSFKNGGETPEAKHAMAYVNSLSTRLIMHIDLHETTDTDNSEFRPALAARDGVVHDNWNIPDGFYLVGHAKKPEVDFHHSILDSVEQVTHIAPADEQDRLIGEPVVIPGLIFYDATNAGLCMGLSNAPYVSTTEVYPDSPKASPEECVNAQVAAVLGGVRYVLSHLA